MERDHAAKMSRPMVTTNTKFEGLRGMALDYLGQSMEAWQEAEDSDDMEDRATYYDRAAGLREVSLTHARVAELYR
jgi:hypothetical protein